MASEFSSDTALRIKEDEKNLRIYINSEYLKPYCTDIYYIQNWFTKISWRRKMSFCKDLFYILRQGQKMIELLYFIGMPGKDLVYAKEQFTKTSYDVKPLDHNRALNEEEITKVHNYYVNWFKTLGDDQQLQIFAGLLQIGGSALAERIYSMTLNFLCEAENKMHVEEEKEERIIIKKKMLRKKKHRHIAKKDANKKVTKKTHTLKKEKLKKAKHKKKKDPKVLLEVEQLKHQHHLVKEDRTLSDIVKTVNLADLFLSNKPDIEARRELRKLKQTWERFISNFKIPITSTVLPEIDKIQMLPIWANRRIISSLPENMYGNLSKVNEYWREMISQVRKEKKARKSLDFAVLSLASSAEVYRLDLTGSKREQRKSEMSKKSKGKKVKKKRTKKRPKIKIKKKKRAVSHPLSRRRPLKVSREVKSANPDLCDLPEVEFDRTPISDLFHPLPKKYHFFEGKCLISIVCDEYIIARSGDASQRWIAYSDNCDVKFLCCVTGAPAAVKLKDCHNEEISCLIFHPNGSQFFTGSLDGNIKLFDVWSQRCKFTYFGHESIITNIAANEWYIVSCSTDLRMKVFRIVDAVCVLTIDLEDSLPTKISINHNCTIYIGDESGQLNMFELVDSDEEASDDDVTLGSIPQAHLGQITSLSVYPGLVISGGIDEYARVWDEDFTDPHWILSFRHHSLSHIVRVNSGLVSFLKLFTATEDGWLLVWDMMESTLIRKIQINTNGRPILSMTCLELDQYVKFIVFSEFDIKVVEFALPWKRFDDNYIWKNVSKTKQIDEMKRLAQLQDRLTKKDIRLMKLHYRNAIQKQLRCPEESESKQKPTLFSLTSQDVHTVKSFRRHWK